MERLKKLFQAPGAPDHSADFLNGVSFEVKFLLDSDRVLTEQYLPTESLTEAFALEECQRIHVLYLETGDRAFNREGWINRIRWKSWRKKPEQTYKKRYPVEGTDPDAIRAALNRIREDGLDVSSKDCKLEVDWGHSKMTLSATWEASVKYRDLPSLNQFNTGDAIACAASGMPEQELNWKREGWGRETLSHAQKIGPLMLLRAIGRWDNTELTLDIIRLSKDLAPTTELSFRTSDYQTALNARTRLTNLLESRGILLKEDYLKTQAVLDAHLLEAPNHPDYMLPASVKRIDEQTIEDAACHYLWIGDTITDIQDRAFAACQNLRYLRLPARAIEISACAFPENLKPIIIGAPGSNADAYAHEHGYGFIPEYGQR